MSIRLQPLGTLLIVALLGFLFVAVPSATDDKARIGQLEVDVRGWEVLVSFQLDGAFDDEVRQRIASGLPTSFAYELRLVRRRKMWFDRDVLSTTVQRVAMYNALTREYLINTKHDGNLVGSRVVHDLEELEHAMTRVEAFPAFDLEGVELDRQVTVRARAELGTRTILGLIPDSRNTEWAESPRFDPTPGG